MEFEYTDVFYLNPVDFEEMVRLVVEKGQTPQMALNQIAYRLEDEDFYAIGKVEDKIIEEIKKRVDTWLE